MSKVYSRRIFLQLLAGTIATAAYAIPRNPCTGPGGWLGPPGFCDSAEKNNIGVAGAEGFGVGIAPSKPTGFTLLSANPKNDNYGNYQYEDGSIMCWIPAFYYRIGHEDNPTYATYGVNSVDVLPRSAFADTAAANAAGYALHRAFIDGGVEQAGFMVDKYMCSKRAKGTGFVASSIKNGLPISTHPDHNPIADLTACAGNNYFYAIDAAHARDGVNGAVNAGSIFFPTSRFIQSALALLALAHGQAATAATYCAWYDATGTTNFPKGCNNNALADANDTAVVWESDGYSNCGKTGSAGFGGGVGNEFAKSTHNGQACGVADVNGLMWEVNIGITCVATTLAIEAVTSAAAPVFTVTGHGLAPGRVIQIGNITQADWDNFKDRMWTVDTTPDADTFTLVGAPDATAYAAYDAEADPGYIQIGTFYTAAEAAAMKDFTSGTATATDHWSDLGIAAMMQEIDVPWATEYSANGFAQRYGNGAAQVLSDAVSGDEWLLAGLGIPSAAAGISTSGTTLYGQDYYYQYIVNQLYLGSGGNWSSGRITGPWAVSWFSSRGYSDDAVGFRCACYPV